jgi:hypothetical protein
MRFQITQPCALLNFICWVQVLPQRTLSLEVDTEAQAKVLSLVMRPQELE